MGFARDINLGVIGKTTFFLIYFNKIKGFGGGGREEMTSTDLITGILLKICNTMESFQAQKVMIEFKFIHGQEAHGISSFN